MIAGTISFILAIMFAFNWNKERELRANDRKKLPENIRKLYLGEK